jgi:hypothetical protein
MLSASQDVYHPSLLHGLSSSRGHVSSVLKTRLMIVVIRISEVGKGWIKTH